MAAVGRRHLPVTRSRKVGTPQSRVLARARSGRPDGQCNREQTADGPVHRSQVRVKRCGKSAPACGATRTARSTPLGADQAGGTGCSSVPVRRDSLRVDRTDGWSPPLRRHRIPLTGWLTVTTTTCNAAARAAALRSARRGELTQLAQPLTPFGFAEPEPSPCPQQHHRPDELEGQVPPPPGHDR